MIFPATLTGIQQNSGPESGTCSNCRGVVTIDDSVSPAHVTFNEYYIMGALATYSWK
jgi:hypothetical protein